MTFDIIERVKALTPEERLALEAAQPLTRDPAWLSPGTASFSQAWQAACSGLSGAPALRAWEKVVTLDHDCPVLVLGGPGSGKTTLSLLKAQAMLPVLQPGQEILFLSFSRAAVRQVEIRCRDILRSDERRQIAVRTYHAFAMDILRAHGRLLTGGAPRIIYPGDENLAKAAFEGDWGAEVERLAREEGRYAFGQVAAAAARLVVGSASIASLLANKYPVVILDEFQDTDDAQWALVKALSARSKTVFMADPDQRIFDYDARVDPERLNHLRTHLGPAEFDLSGENHRSPDAGILQYANAVLTPEERLALEAGVHNVDAGLGLRVHVSSVPGVYTPVNRNGGESS